MLNDWGLKIKSALQFCRPPAVQILNEKPMPTDLYNVEWQAIDVKIVLRRLWQFCTENSIENPVTQKFFDDQNFVFRPRVFGDEKFACKKFSRSRTLARSCARELLKAQQQRLDFSSALYTFRTGRRIIIVSSSARF